MTAALPKADIKGKIENRKSLIFSLNETGILLWKSLEQGAKKEELQQILRNEYEVDEITVKEDVEEFLNKLRSLDVLEE